MTVIPPDISIVVLTYNDPDSLFRCLGSIPSGVEVIVTDDGTLPRLGNQLPKEKVDHYVWQEDIGNRASTARNKGFEFVTRPKVLFLDDDVELHPMALAAHSICLNMYDASLGLLPREKWKPHTDDRMKFYIREDDMGWNYCWSGNLAMRSSVFEDIGGFDGETFDGGQGFEDIDLGRRLHQAGHRLHINRLAMAYHPDPQAAFSERPHDLLLVNQHKYEKKWKGAGVRAAPSVMQ